MTEQARGVDPAHVWEQIKRDSARLLPATEAESQSEPNKVPERHGSAFRTRIHFGRHSVSLGVGEGISTASVELMPVSSAPSGERGRVDVSFDDDVALSNQTLASLFSIILPLQEGSMQLGPINEHGHQLVEVCFAIPNHRKYLDV